jgi:uncharacterized membrane protein YedE/YeeE
MKRSATALGAGLLFGIGLCLSGMIDPRRIVAFLDVSGRWDPSLAAVMVGAIGVHASLLRLLGRRGGVATGATPIGGAAIDGRLIVGSALFGVGWGLSGYCPGPAILSLGFGTARALGLVGAMIAGALLADAVTAATVYLEQTRQTPSRNISQA